MGYRRAGVRGLKGSSAGGLEGWKSGAAYFRSLGLHKDPNAEWRTVKCYIRHLADGPRKYISGFKLTYHTTSNSARPWPPSTCFKTVTVKFCGA